jgi:hypothetical protein
MQELPDESGDILQATFFFQASFLHLLSLFSGEFFVSNNKKSRMVLEKRTIIMYTIIYNQTNPTEEVAMSNFDPFANGSGNGQQQNDQQQSNRQNDQQQGNQQQFYGQSPYGQPPFGQPPYGQPPYGQPMQDDQDGRTSKMFGIISIVLNIFSCCLPVGIVLGILAIVRAGASKRTLGYQSPDAHLGKVLGIISVIWGSLTFAASLLYLVFVVALGILEASGGGTMV